MRTFSMGAIYAVPAGANPTPIPIASLKSAKVGFKQAKKKFNGNQRVAVDVGDGPLDITLDIESADFRASALALVVPGAVTTVGALMAAIAEAATVAATVTVTNSATFVEDAGVLDYTSGKWMTRVSGSPIASQYSEAAGVYTFAAADVGHLVAITYSYSSATNGQTSTYKNTIQGQSVAYKTRVYNPWVVNGQPRLKGYDFASVHYEELDADLKIEDFAAHSLKGFASQDMIGTSQLVFTDYNSEIG